jgi:hypothetical protein
VAPAKRIWSAGWRRIFEIVAPAQAGAQVLLLLAMTPANYTGLAAQLAKAI